MLMIRDGKCFEYGGHRDDTTNNIMEMTAALEALKLLESIPGPATIHTDSQYLKKGITGWVHVWKVKGWKKSDGDDVKNLEIWKELDLLNRPEIRWEWVKGHGDNPFNNRADEIARAFAKNEPIKLARGDKKSPDRGELLKEKIYLSLVGGELARHSDWKDCKARVTGVPGAKFKACKNMNQQKAVLEEWGISPGEIHNTPVDAQVSTTSASSREIQSTAVLVGLPFVETFAGNLARKGFCLSEYPSPELLYHYTRDDLNVRVYPRGFFEFIGPMNSGDRQMLRDMGRGEDRYVQKFMTGFPVDVPEDLSVWDQEILKIFIRPFYRGLVTSWKFQLDSNSLRIWPPGQNPFSVILSPEIQWDELPPESMEKEIHAFTLKSAVFADRLCCSFAGEPGAGTSSAILQVDCQSLQFSRLREWDSFSDDFLRLSEIEQNRHKALMGKYLPRLKWHWVGAIDRNSAVGNLARWLCREIKKSSPVLAPFKGNVLPEILIDQDEPTAGEILDKCHKFIHKARFPEYCREGAILQFARTFSRLTHHARLHQGSPI